MGWRRLLLCVALYLVTVVAAMAFTACTTSLVEWSGWAPWEIASPDEMDAFMPPDYALPWQIGISYAFLAFVMFAFRRLRAPRWLMAIGALLYLPFMMAAVLMIALIFG